MRFRYSQLFQANVETTKILYGVDTVLAVSWKKLHKELIWMISSMQLKKFQTVLIVHCLSEQTKHA